MSPAIRALVVVVCSLTLSGCHKDNSQAPRFDVSGTVTLDGKPLADGLIYFKTPATGSIECFEIKEGKFSGKAELGERRVEIYSLKTKMEVFDGMKSETKENLIPKQYNQESKLTSKVKTLGVNEFEYQLIAKADDEPVKEKE